MRIGIDPGLTGAIVLIGDEEILQIWDMPITAKTHGKGNEVNAFLLNDIITDAQTIAYSHGQAATAILERVGAMPGQGVTSMFGFGRSMGVLEGVLAGQGIQTDYVTPQRWKKSWNLVGKDKDAARGVCLARWPEWSQSFARKKDIGRADAALIAAYGVSG